LTRKTYAQSEPDIISAVAAHATKWGLPANGLTQGESVNPFFVQSPDQFGFRGPELTPYLLAET
jgi:hypothetical protein